MLLVQVQGWIAGNTTGCSIDYYHPTNDGARRLHVVMGGGLKGVDGS